MNNSENLNIHITASIFESLETKDASTNPNSSYYSCSTIFEYSKYKSSGFVYTFIRVDEISTGSLVYKRKLLLNIECTFTNTKSLSLETSSATDITQIKPIFYKKPVYLKQHFKTYNKDPPLVYLSL